MDLSTLIQNSEDVLPGTMRRANLDDYDVFGLKVVSYVGTKSTLAVCEFRGRRRYVRHKTVLMMTGEKIRMRCSCESYREVFAGSNTVSGAQYGRHSRMKPRAWLVSGCIHVVMLARLIRQN